MVDSVSDKMTRFSTTIELLRSYLRQGKHSLRALSLPKRLKSSGSFKYYAGSHLHGEPPLQSSKSFSTGKSLQHKISSLEKTVKELKAANEQLSLLNSKYKEQIAKHKELVERNKNFRVQINKYCEQVLNVQEHYLILKENVSEAIALAKQELIDSIIKKLHSEGTRLGNVEQVRKKELIDADEVRIVEQPRENETQEKVAPSKMIQELAAELKRKEAEVVRRDAQIVELKGTISELQRERVEKAIEEKKVIENLQKRLAEAESTDNELIEKLNQIQIE